MQISFEGLENGVHYHIPLLLSPFGFTTYRGTAGIPLQSSESITSTTYFIGPGRGAHANSELLTISTQSKEPGIETNTVLIQNNKCKDMNIPEYPLGAISGYNMQVDIAYVHLGLFSEIHC